MGKNRAYLRPTVAQVATGQPSATVPPGKPVLLTSADVQLDVGLLDPLYRTPSSIFPNSLQIRDDESAKASALEVARQRPPLEP